LRPMPFASIRPVAALLLATLAPSGVLAQEAGPIAAALADADGAVRLYDAHVTTLANPFMGGRLPGTPAMERAKAYVEHYFERAGLSPAFEGRWRQPFSLGDVTAENVGGLLPGSGELADEIVVVGAHLDHLGKGAFGSRGTPGELHPGADDNASGVAAVLLLADELASRARAHAGDRRTVLFLAFSGEESGLNGASHYVDHPVAPLPAHTLMLNLDMIGRISGKRVAVSGVDSAVGLREWLGPYFAASPIEEVVQDGLTGRSDHWAFYTAGVPVLFATNADTHEDYHTERDVSWKINRSDAVGVVRTFAGVVHDLATRGERLVYVGGQRPAGGAGPGLSDIRVRFGIRPGSYAPGQSGVAVGGVTPGTTASLAGVREGDVLVAWDGEAIEDVRGWMAMLARHDPGDRVVVTVLRGGARVELEAVLQGKGGT